MFSDVSQQVEEGSGRIFALHNAVVDEVYHIPLSLDDFKRMLDAGEQRFKGRKEERVGGGGINFALTASSLGFPGIHFVGSMDRYARVLVERIKRDNRLGLPLSVSTSRPRRNTIMEMSGPNLLFHDDSAADADAGELVRRVRQLEPAPSDWVASCSFYPNITFELLPLTRRFFLDSGYGYPRREQKMLTALLDKLKELRFAEFMIAANDTELENMGQEQGVRCASIMDKGRYLSSKLSDITGSKVTLLLHTTHFSSLFEPSGAVPWLVPTMDISVNRRTNAGDTFAGAFLPAYDATGDAVLAAFFANAAAAKRLTDDELPTRDNTADFLRRVRMRDFEAAGARTIRSPALMARVPLPAMPTASSAGIAASAASKPPAL